MNLDLKDIFIKRSGRKTLCIEIRPDGAVLIRAPYRATAKEIEAFVMQHGDWILRHREKAIEKNASRPPVMPLTMEEIRRLADLALQVIPQRVKFFAEKMGVSYGRITIRNQKSKWGSCTSKGNLNFNCLLMLAPPEVVDAIVVHELAHRKEMNHSPRFYEEVLRVYPDYKKWDRWLKENGDAIMRRMTG